MTTPKTNPGYTNECAVLGSIFLSEYFGIQIAAAALNPSDFADVRNRTVFSAMRNLFDAGTPPDVTLVLDALEKSGDLAKIGGPAYVTSLEQYVIAPWHIAHHCGKVRECAVNRETRQELGVLSAEAAEGRGVEEMLPKMREALERLSTRTGNVQVVNIQDAATTAYNDLIAELEEPVSHVLTGIPPYDRSTRGMAGGNLIILAARPGVGKSALAGNIEMNALEAGKRVVLFSYEMSLRELMQRHISRLTRVSLEKQITLTVTEEDIKLIKRGLEHMRESWRYEIYDGMDSDPEKMAAVVQALSTTGPVDLIVVDYLQLMAVDKKNYRKGDNRNLELGHITRGLKAMARQFRCPVLALSQMSRAVELRGKSARPQLSDLRESGAIEQDADQVWFLHEIRPECKENGHLAHVDLILAKQRQGRKFTIPMVFFGPSMKWDIRETQRQAPRGHSERYTDEAERINHV